MIPYVLAALVVLEGTRFIMHKKAGHSLADVSWAREAGVALLTAVLAALMAKTVLQGILIVDGRLRFLYRFSGAINFIAFNNFDLISGAKLIDILSNTVIFIPIGLLLPILFKPFKRWWMTVGFCFLLSFFIEVVQLFLPRTTDINDLLLNTAGGVVGYLVYSFIRGKKNFKLIKSSQNKLK